MKNVPTTKLYYSIKEVAELFDEEQHILRYWEREFPLLHPQKNRAGNRVYVEKDLRVLRVLKTLIRKERLTVSAAKKILLDGIPENYLHVADFAQLPAQENRSFLSSQSSSLDENMVMISRRDAEQLLHVMNDLLHVLQKL